MFKKVILTVFLSLPILLSAQQLTGRITDSESGMAIGFASIGLTKTNQGANANQDGRFTLAYSSLASGDSLVVSCVGYTTIKLSIQKDRSFYDIRLQRKASVLREVIIRSFTKKITLPWESKRSGLTLSTMGINTQVARLLEAPETFSRVESVRVATGSHGIFDKDKEARFRIRIYDYDSAFGMPGADLCDSVIEVVGKGVVVVNLEKYRIIIPQKRFFVSVEWLMIDENKNETSAVTSDKKDTLYTTYRPRVRIRRTDNDDGNCWQLYHNRNWVRWKKYEVFLTATVSY
jgi:hypothetical protein